MVEMVAKKGFANPRIEGGGPRGDGSIEIGDKFSTDWLHARDLAKGGLADAVNPSDLDTEPTEALTGANHISRTELAAINDRRGKAAASATTAKMPPAGK